MKELFKIPWNCKIIVMIFISSFLGTLNKAYAQLPDCITGTVMYAAFSPVAPTVGNDSTEIRSVNYATGAIGPLMGGRRYYIQKTPGTTTFYGSSAMGVSPVTSKFYLITQMGSSSTQDGPKDLIMIDPIAPTASGTVIGTITGTTGGIDLDEYHFVKMAIAPNGFGYALGVYRRTTGAAATYNILIRYSLCATTNCSTIQLLGFLPSGGITDKNNLFNGDIAFDGTGNLYFLASSFQPVGSITKYTDTRLFKILSTDIPSLPGTGTIPMSFLNDFNSLDSTGASGIALDPGGNMYFTVRRYTNNDPTAAFVTELHKSNDTSSTILMPGFSPIPANTSAGDLGSCFFPNSVLTTNKLQLSGKSDIGNAYVQWQVNNNNLVNYYELQRSDDGINFTTIETINPTNASQSSAVYQYKDTEKELGKYKYYRIRQVMKNGLRYYSNIVQVNFNSKINLTGSLSPNPFIDHFNFIIELNSSKSIGVRLTDQSGRIVYNKSFNGKAGENKITVNDISKLKKGFYFVEISAENEVIRQKLIRQ